MKKTQLRKKLISAYQEEKELLIYLIKEHGADSYKAAYSRGFLAGLEEALYILEKENEKDIHDKA